MISLSVRCFVRFAIDPQYNPAQREGRNLRCEDRLMDIHDLDRPRP